MAAGAMAALVPVTGCAQLLEDRGPLPPRPSPVPADTVVSDMIEAFAAEGVRLDRTPRRELPIDCYERLVGRYKASASHTAVKSAFVHARSAYDWRPGGGLGSTGIPNLQKGNWTAMATVPSPHQHGPDVTQISVTLMCHDRPETSPRPARPSSTGRTLMSSSP
ncbi:hypothetical protein [Streptomyces sp. NPDC002851]